MIFGADDAERRADGGHDSFSSAFCSIRQGVRRDLPKAAAGDL
jgi:hypothetical protein